MFRVEIIGNLGADASVMESNGSKMMRETNMRKPYG